MFSEYSNSSIPMLSNVSNKVQLGTRLLPLTCLLSQDKPMTRGVGMSHMSWTASLHSQAYIPRRRTLIQVLPPLNAYTKSVHTYIHFVKPVFASSMVIDLLHCRACYVIYSASLMGRIRGYLLSALNDPTTWDSAVVLCSLSLKTLTKNTQSFKISA